MKKIFKNTHYMVGSLLLCLLALGQLQRVEIKSIAFYLHDIVILGWAGLLTLQQVYKPLLKFLKKITHSQKIAIGLLGIWIILGWSVSWLSQGWQTWPLLYSARIAAYSYLFSLLFTKRFFSRKLISSAIDAYFGILLLFGWLQWLLLPDTRFLAILGWDDHYYRMLGTQFDPNFWGLLLILSFWWFFWKMKQTGKSVYLFSLIFLLSGLVITWSRASYLAFAISIIASWVLSLYQRKTFQITKTGAALAFVLVGILVTPKPSGEGGNLLRTQSIENRVATAQTNVTLTIPELILGKGLFIIPTSTQDVRYHAKQPDNFFLTLLSGIGLGGITFLGLVGWSFRKEIKQEIRSLKTNPLPITYLSLATILVHSLFNNSLLQPFILLTWFTLILGKTAKKKSN